MAIRFPTRNLEGHNSAHNLHSYYIWSSSRTFKLSSPSSCIFIFSSLYSLWSLVFYFSHPPNKSHNSTISLPLNPCKKYTLWVNLSVTHPFSDLRLTLLLEKNHTSTSQMVLLCINKLCSVWNACFSIPTRLQASLTAISYILCSPTSISLHGK